jgi:hypothetical protein
MAISEPPALLQKNGPLLRKVGWCTAFILTLLMPWAIAIGSANALEAWLPGEVKTDYWRNLSSLSFLIGGIVAALMLLRLKKGLGLRVAGSIFVLLGAIWFALMFQLRSKCGDESIYIGTKPGMQVATCG